MTIMSTDDYVDAIALEAGLTPAQTASLGSTVASWAMEGMRFSSAELRVLAELTAGRIDFAEYRRRLGV
jgi:hypothetical protein